MSLGSGRDGSAREDGRAVEDVDVVETVERVEVLGGRGFLESFFGILEIRGFVSEVVREIVVMQKLGVERLDFFVVAPRWGDVTSLTCVL
jgi:hypothetical protein